MDANSDNNNEKTTLMSSMSCGIFTNEDGKIMFLHEQPLHEDVQWIEYNSHCDALTLVFEGGELLDAGIALDDKTRGNFQHGIDVLLTHIQDSKIRSAKFIPMIFQDY